jgi:hypothetical protein
MRGFVRMVLRAALVRLRARARTYAPHKHMLRLAQAQPAAHRGAERVWIACAAVSMFASMARRPVQCLARCLQRQPIAVLVELARKLSQVVERTPVDGNIPNVLRSPCGTSASPTTARNAVSAQGKSI